MKFEATFPMARLTFCDSDFPGKVKLCAFNPFIPHNDLDSSMPVAMFEWEIENTTCEEIRYAVAFTVQNPASCSQNISYKQDGYTALFFEDRGHDKNEIGYSDLCALTDSCDAETQVCWYRGGWMDAPTTYWKNFTESERMMMRAYDECGDKDHGTVVSYIKVEPGKRKKVRFVLSWNVPNQYNYWNPCKDENGKDVTWKNYYATVYESSLKSGEAALKRFSELRKRTEEFTQSLKNSSLPTYVKEAVSANLSVLKSPTVLRLQDGSLWGWEGCMETVGSCDGSCQHVWNYAYALPFLFPKLERSLRENTMNYAMYDDGGTIFRVPLPLGRKVQRWRSCVDGQMGEVIKCYREWKISGDTEWLRKYSNKIFKMLEFAWHKDNPDRWDSDKDGVLDGRCHHTLDMELFGPSSWLEGFYLLALDCGAKMAQALGDDERYRTYIAMYENGKKWMNENLFNGRYFYHKIDLTDENIPKSFDAPNYWNSEAKEIKYQVAQGCIIDQMLADWHSGIIGCQGVFQKEKKKIALENLYKNNFKKSMRDVVNMWRNFSLNDEAGAIICSYPKGVKVPAIPIPYCEETMTGFEYSLAGLLIMEGFADEGENIVKAVRQRYDGEKRNPWNEIECGNNYARSMASYALMTIYSGFRFDMTEKKIGFNPLRNGQYQWSVCDTWGNVITDSEKITLTVLGNPLKLSLFEMGNDRKVKTVICDGKEIEFKTENGALDFGDIEICKKLVIKINGKY